MVSRLFAVSCGLVVAAGAALLAQQVAILPRAGVERKVSPIPRTDLRVDADLVLVPVTVCDPMNRPVTGLEKRHFRVFDNNVEQTVTDFAMDDAPAAVGLVFDTSGSMGSKLRLSREAAEAFFQTANPEDEFFLVQFSDKPKLTVPLTHDPQQVEARLAKTTSRGRTALLDAIVLALHEMKKADRSRKALLIISDGGDNCSRYTEGELKDMVMENDVLVYAIGVYGGGTSPEEAAGPKLLKEMADQTGGRDFIAKADELPDIAAKIGEELHNRYVLGFSPTDDRRDGRYHPVKIQLVPPRGLPPLHAYWRKGYYAPE